MKRKILICCFVILSFKLFSQDLLFEQELTLKSVFTDKRESFPIVNEINNEIVLFLLDNKNINSLLFNSNYELIDNFTTDRPESIYNTLLGYSSDSIMYHLFFTNEYKSQFYIRSVNLIDKKAEGKLLSLKLRDERFLETISYKNKFYLITIKKRSSILKIYEFINGSNNKTEELDFSSYKFSNTGYSKLFDVFKRGSIPFQSTFNIHKIDNSNPNPLDISTKENKIYYYNDKIYITIDNNLGLTQLIEINITDYSTRIMYYRQVFINCDNDDYVKSNSYLFGDKLFQIKGCSKELRWQIKDLNRDSIIKEFRIKEDEEITIKNTPLIQEGGTTIFTQATEKELNKTKQLLRKISLSDIGISVSQSRENIELTIGGFKAVQRSNGGAGMMNSQMKTTSTSHGTINTSTYHYNPIMYGYNTYTYSRSIYFKSLLDNFSFKHTEGNVADNVYDKIRDFESGNYNNMTSKTIFKVDEYSVFGYYNKLEKKYYLRKFTN